MRAFVLLFALIALGGGGGGGLEAVADLQTPRATHTATALPDGRVLVAGGCIDPGCETATATTELYDLGTRRSVAGPKLGRPRVGHAAVALRDGSVLLLGGFSGRTPTASAERFVAGRIVPVAPMGSPRGGFTATRLRDGRVLVVGGSDGSSTLASAELYEPATGRFTPTGAPRRARNAHSASLLRDGRVLVLGGSDGDEVLRSAEIYDPRPGLFAPAGLLRAARHKHAAVTLRDGRVRVLGGSDARDFRGRYRTTEVWSPATRRFRPAPALREPRFKLPDAAVRLPSGDVLVAGGGRSVERGSPGGRFVLAGTVGRPYSFATATLTADDQVLVAGGYDDSIVPTADAWIFSP